MIACAITSNSYEPGSQQYFHLKQAENCARNRKSGQNDMATQSTENVSLKGPEDWEAWNTQFESKAISTDLWRLISPDEDQEDTEPFAEKPSPPKVSDYNKKLTRETWLQNTQSTATAQALGS